MVIFHGNPSQMEKHLEKKTSFMWVVLQCHKPAKTGNGTHIYHLYILYIYIHIYGDLVGDGKHGIVLPTAKLSRGHRHSRFVWSHEIPICAMEIG